MLLNSVTGKWNRVPETHLAVAAGVDVPRGRRLEEPGEPRTTRDEGSERVLHCGRGIEAIRAGGGAVVVGGILGICAKWANGLRLSKTSGRARDVTWASDDHS